jgi:hypothetical protein
MDSLLFLGGPIFTKNLNNDIDVILWRYLLCVLKSYIAKSACLPFLYIKRKELLPSYNSFTVFLDNGKRSYGFRSDYYRHCKCGLHLWSAKISMAIVSIFQHATLITSMS